MIKEIFKAILLILFLLAVMITVGSCGTRRSSQSKEIKRVQIQSLKTEQEKSTISSSIRMYETREASNESNEIYDNETVEETYSLDPDGKPYLSGRTINKSKGTKSNKEFEKTNSTEETKVDQTKNSEKSDQVEVDLVGKSKDKNTESDKTIVTNFGGDGWLFLIIVLIAIVILAAYLIKKKKKF